MSDELKIEHSFEREERYIVIKRKYLHPMTEASLRADMRNLCINTVECVVVESDWPEYETVWRMIEDRVSDRLAAQSPITGDDVERVARAICVAGNYTDYDTHKSVYDTLARAAIAALRPSTDLRGTQTVARTPDGLLWLYGGNQWRPSTPTEGEGLANTG